MAKKCGEYREKIDREHILFPGDALKKNSRNAWRCLRPGNEPTTAR
jgi:hypothetical protein